MYTKICPICNCEFETPNNHYRYCSAECRKEHTRQYDKERAKIYYHSSRGTHNRKIYYKEHRKLVEKYCPDCGKRLEDGRQTWCLDCLLKDYATTESPVAYKRLVCRGYDRELITEEINSRGITRCEF